MIVVHNSDYEIIIIGFGPVGAVAACLLGQQKRRVLVVDREHEMFPLPRAIVLDDETMRLFRSLGLDKEIEPFITPIQTVELLDPAGNRLVGYDVSGDTPKPNGFYPNYFFHQPSVDAILRRAVSQIANIEVVLATELVALKQAPGQVEVTLKSNTGTPQTVRAQYVLGCDGARSTVRNLLDIPTQSLGYDHRWLVVDADAFEGHDQPGRVSQICDPRRRVTVIKGERVHHRWEFQLAADECSEEPIKPEFIWHLLKPWASPDEVVLTRTAAYRFHSTFAERWHDKRVFLLGDAAHQMPPFMGQGMCTGLRDAANLSWKIGKVLDGFAGSDLLETYSEERIPHARDMVEWSVEVGLLIDAFAAKVSGDDRLLDELNQSSGYGAGRELAAVDGAMFNRSIGHRLIGRTLPLVRAADGRMVDDIQGGSFALVRPVCGENLKGVSRNVARGVIEISLPHESWVELERFGGHPVLGALLVRPDRLVCAVGEPTELLAHLECWLPGAPNAPADLQTAKTKKEPPEEGDEHVE